MQWESTKDDSLNSRCHGTRGGIHAVSDLSQLESRFFALENMMKGLVSNQSHLPKLLICAPNAIH